MALARFPAKARRRCRSNFPPLLTSTQAAVEEQHSWRKRKMILQQENWFFGYAAILKACREGGDDAMDSGSSGSSALILCQADVDAMCAGRILTYMLRQDNVNYQLLPCMNHVQLQERVYANRHLVRAVILLNLGATRNLTRLFDASSNGNGLNPNRTTVFVMDCRRPVHLANIYAERNVVVFWDETQNDDNLPSDGDNLSGHESSSSSSSSDDDDDEDEEGDNVSSGSEENEFDAAPRNDDGKGDDDGDADAAVGDGDSDDDNDGDQSVQSTRSTAVDRRGGGTDNPTSPPPALDVGMDQSAEYDGEDEGDHDGLAKKRKEVREHDDDNQRDDDSVSLTAPETDVDTVMPTQTTQPSMTPREQHYERRNRLRQYYISGSYYGSPAAYVTHVIATQQRFGDNGDLLWLACVGVTDAYLHSRLDVSGYSALAMHLRNLCNGLFPNDHLSRVSNTVYSEHLLGGDASYLTRISFSGNGQVFTLSDFRFFMLRHSSLLDAMMYSDYVSTRLQLPSAAGLQKLYEMLAKMGYPLDQCQQPISFMKPNLRRQLQDKLREYAEEYGLTNFEFTSFFRLTGYNSLLSASDTSYAVSALLECDSGSGGGNRNDAALDEEEQLIDAFNIAYDSLNPNPAAASTSSTGGGTTGSTSFVTERNNLGNLVNGGKLNENKASGLGAGIVRAKKLQRTIMATASQLLERSAITTLTHFRYAYITVSSGSSNGGSRGEENLHPSRQGGGRASKDSSSSSSTNHVFAKPLALTRLAHYLMDWHRENGKWTGSKALPLVLLAEKPSTRTYLVVAYEYPETHGDIVRNKFGPHFLLAAQSMKGTFKFDSFESNVVEVAAQDVQRYIEQLYYLMDSSGGSGGAGGAYQD